MSAQSDSVDMLAPQVAAISNYIARGIEHGCGDCIGLELEHFIVGKNDHSYVPYLDDPYGFRPGVKSILERLAPLYSEMIYETQSDGSKDLIGLSREYAAITLEPGAQFEISIGPVLEIRDLDIVYRMFRNELDPLLDEFGYELIELGYHPTICAHEIPLLPKDRYRFMDEHFKSTGRHGICMMRATASTQVSIDYDSEKDAIRKFRIANALSPLLAFITDNSPVFETEPIGNDRASVTGLTIPQRMVRTVIWDDVDADRSMTAPGVFDAEFDFDSYARTALCAPAILTIESDSEGIKRSIPHGSRLFSELFEGRVLTRADIEHILSLYFFDVRFKTYIEIRAADSLPIAYALSYAAFLKGLFYNKETVRDLAARFEGLSSKDIAAAKFGLRTHGFFAEVYGRAASDWLDELLMLARRSLCSPERAYLGPLAELIASRTTLIDRPEL